MNTAELVASFEQYLTTEKRFSEHTITAYLNDIDQFVKFTLLETLSDWQDVNMGLVRGWVIQLHELKCSPRTINRKLSCLRSLFGWLKANELVIVNPLLKLKGPKLEKRLPQFAKESAFEEERMSILFSNDFDGIRDRLMVELFYQTGIRLSELISLTEQNVTSTHIKVIGKRNKERLIPIGTELFDRINTYRKIKPIESNGIPNLFVQWNGRKLNEKFVYRKINTYLGTVTNLQKRSPHILRHTFATHMLNNGAGLETLKELLGHASLSATQVYTHNSFAQINTIYSQAHPRGRKT